MSKMVIAEIHPFLNLMGGAERKALLLHNLLSESHSLHFYTMDFSKQKTFEELIQPKFNPIIGPRKNKFLWFAKIFFSLIVNKYDLVICHNYPANIPCGLASIFKPKLKVVWICNEVGPRLSNKEGLLWSIYCRIERLISRRIKYVISNSEYTHNEIFSYYGIKSTIIRSGITISESTVHSPPLPEELKTIDLKESFFTLTRIEKHKNIQFLEELIKSLPLKNFIVAGKGKDSDYLENLSKSYKNLFYLGPISSELKDFLYSTCQAFIFLPEKEPLGVTIMEALLRNSPVVAYNSGGPRETVLNGENGVLVESKENYIQALKKVRSLPKVNDSNGRNYIVENFSNERMLKDFATYFDTVLEEKYNERK